MCSKTSKERERGWGRGDEKRFNVLRKIIAISEPNIEVQVLVELYITKLLKFI